jgi:hypothetical protein
LIHRPGGSREKPQIKTPIDCLRNERSGLTTTNDGDFSMQHLEHDYDRETLLADLAMLSVEIDRLLLAADHSNDIDDQCDAIARKLKNITVIHTNVLREGREKAA